MYGLPNGDMGYQTIFSTFKSNKDGVCILFNNNFKLQLQKLFIDPLGRFIICKINANEKSLTFANKLCSQR